MKKPIALLIVVIMVASTLSFAFQTSTVSAGPGLAYYDLTITVIDASVPVVGAQVAVTGPETRTGNTDSNGQITFDLLKAGQYEITVIALGYLSPAPQFITLNSDLSLTIELEIIPVNMVPEVPFGTIIALAALSVGFVTYVGRRKIRIRL
jgi:hypothetical protein